VESAFASVNRPVRFAVAIILEIAGHFAGDRSSTV
jgi:hypothetical protein